MSAISALTIPNILTFGRIVITVFFFSAGLQGDWPAALTFFVAAAVTDMVDGTLARILNQKTKLGAFIDPAADKLMMLAGVTLLTIDGTLPWWLMALIVGRDLYIVLGLYYLWYVGGKIAFKPLILSKLTTLSQILTISFGFVEATRSAGFEVWGWMHPFADFLLWMIGITTVLTIITTFQYTQVGLKILRGTVGRNV